MAKNDSTVEEVLVIPHTQFATWNNRRYSFPLPSVRELLKQLQPKWDKVHKHRSVAALHLFGHANNVQDSQYLGMSIAALLTCNVVDFEELFNVEKWGVFAIQTMLAHLGFEPGTIDGIDGPKTKGAVKAYQEKVGGLQVDGIAGPKTRTKLFNEYMKSLWPNVTPLANIERMGHPNVGNRYGACAKANTNEEKHGPRRVVIYIKSLKGDGGRWPCHKCKGETNKTSGQRTAGFGCFAYDAAIVEPETKTHTNEKKEKIQYGIFFDGTGNNRNDDIPEGCDTNIAKLFELYIADDKHIYSYYVKGVGTNWNGVGDNPWIGGLTGWGVSQRINKALHRLSEVASQHTDKHFLLDIFGFSRGASEARHFVNVLFDKGLPGKDKKPMEFSFEIRMLGLFDTVSSTGLPGNDIDHNLDLHVYGKRIKNLAHFTARDESRSLFDLQSIYEPHKNVQYYSGTLYNLPKNWIERSFPGAHSDVGGGYGELERENSKGGLPERSRRRSDPIHHNGREGTVEIKSGLALIPLYAMVDFAEKAGVDCFAKVPPDPNRIEAFKIPSDLKRLFDARNDSNLLFELSVPENDYYKKLISQYVHDSRYINISEKWMPRVIYYKGKDTKE